MSKTDPEREAFDDLSRKIVQVPKKELDKEVRRDKKKRKKRRKKK